MRVGEGHFPFSVECYKSKQKIFVLSDTDNNFISIPIVSDRGKARQSRDGTAKHVVVNTYIEDLNHTHTSEHLTLAKKEKSEVFKRRWRLHR